VAIDNPYDMNRDRRVSALDVAAVRQNMGRRLTTPYVTPQQPAIRRRCGKKRRRRGRRCLRGCFRRVRFPDRQYP